MLISDAIARAYREAAIKRIGSTLTADETAEGLIRVNDFLFSLFSDEIGENLVDFPFPPNIRNTPYPADTMAQQYPQNLSAFDQPFTPVMSTTSDPTTCPQNVRILWRGTSASTIYLPEQPSDGARFAFADVGSTATLTINANGRKIDNGTSIGTTVTATNATDPSEWFYRADLGTWIVLKQLATTDSSPLPAKYDSLVVSGAAIRLTALDNIEPTKGTMFIYDRLLKNAKAQYKQHTNTTYGGQNLRPSYQGYSWNREYPSQW